MYGLIPTFRKKGLIIRMKQIEGGILNNEQNSLIAILVLQICFSKY